MTLRLVSEARPIHWNRLSSFEREKIEEADAWMNELLDLAVLPTPKANEINENKSGRVLFIDGERGAGKTSLMLTLLMHWKGEDKDYSGSLDSVARFKKRVEILFPILDFDPLPQGMPLHGWLLEPWRSKVESLDANSGGCADWQDLKEKLWRVFERAVLGWTPVENGGKSVVEKALAYQEQSSGWVDIRKYWYEFVDAVICESNSCHKKDCRGGHSSIFVVAIDDIDLQVEQVPHLLHAIRLLHHPNVVYVLTGNMEHLESVLTLDYISRHGDVHWNVDGSDGPLSDQIKANSNKLCTALLEKGLPTHSRLRLPMLSISAVLAMHADDGGKASMAVEKKIENTKIGKLLPELAKKMTRFEICTARRAQHAIDKYLRQSDVSDAAALNFIADVCGTTVVKADRTTSSSDRYNEKPRVELGGTLTTVPGPILRAWEGEQLWVQLHKPPLFAFRSHEASSSQTGEEANRAAVIQLAVERKILYAHGLDCRPDAGVLSTRVIWNPSSPRVNSVALFHWPWIVRPSISNLLDLEQLVDEILQRPNPEADRINLDGRIVFAWVSQNAKWVEGSKKATIVQSLEGMAALLKRMYEKSGKSDDVKRWVWQLVVMTAPYYGLSDDDNNADRNFSKKMRTTLYAVLESMNRKNENEEKIRLEEVEAVKNAIYIGGSKNMLNSDMLERAANEFLEQRKPNAPLVEPKDVATGKIRSESKTRAKAKTTAAAKTKAAAKKKITAAKAKTTAANAKQTVAKAKTTAANAKQTAAKAKQTAAKTPSAAKLL